MKPKIFVGFLIVLGVAFFLHPAPGSARIKLVALPERGQTMIRLDNPRATLIEEERILTLQKGLNQVDFSWKGVSIDEDSIRLALLTQQDKVTPLSVSYPPGEAALVWEIHCSEPLEAGVRISYLLSYIDRLVAHKGVVDKGESRMDLKSFLILRNFSGEDFEKASVLIDDGQTFAQSIRHGETKQLLLLKKEHIPIEKQWTFDAQTLPWDPHQLETNVGIPVSYKIKNTKEGGLGSSPLPEGKVRVFQDDGHNTTIFLGEDSSNLVPVGEEMKIRIGDSRDIVVTQRKMREELINVRRNTNNQTVLHDTDEIIKATVENFKDQPALLKMIQHIPGQWDMEECNMRYRLADASTLEFEIPLSARGKAELIMHYHRRNLR